MEYLLEDIGEFLDDPLTGCADAFDLAEGVIFDAVADVEGEIGEDAADFAEGEHLEGVLPLDVHDVGHGGKKGGEVGVEGHGGKLKRKT